MWHRVRWRASIHVRAGGELCGDGCPEAIVTAKIGIWLPRSFPRYRVKSAPSRSISTLYSEGIAIQSVLIAGRPWPADSTLRTTRSTSVAQSGLLCRPPNETIIWKKLQPIACFTKVPEYLRLHLRHGSRGDQVIPGRTLAIGTAEGSHWFLHKLMKGGALRCPKRPFDASVMSCLLLSGIAKLPR